LDLLKLILRTPNIEMKSILDKIKAYKESLSNSRDFNEKRAILNSINGLYHRLYEIKENREGLKSEEKYHLSTLIKNDVARQERRMRALRSIFDFYCKKGISMVKKYYTFDSIDRQTQAMSLENFSLLMKDFHIKVEPTVNEFFYHW